MVEWRPLTYPLGSRFFGLTPQYRVSLFSQIHEIVFHGNGGYDYDTIYNMPIWLRNFTFNKMREHYQKEADQMKKAQGKSGGATTVVDSDGKIQAPEHFQNAKKSPTYVAKASKK